MPLERWLALAPAGRRTWSLLALLFLLTFWFQACLAARSDSVTIDEFGHVPTGLYFWQTGDFTPDPMNAPLSRLVSAVPLFSQQPAFTTPPGTPYWALGEVFMHQNAARYQSLFESARSSTIVLALVLGALIALWASRLYGRVAGLLALFLFCFSPCMLAHGHLATLDVPGALGFLVAVLAAWRFLERPTPRRAALAGGAIAVATLLKLSGSILVFLLPIVTAISAGRERGDPARPSRLRWLALLALSGAVFLGVLNLGYGFQGTLTAIGTGDWSPGGALDRVRQATPWVRLPLPGPFLAGVDQIMTVGKNRQPQFFLAGEMSSEGWWYYHLAAFAFKTPLPLLAALLLAIGSWVTGRTRGRRDYCLFLAIVLIFAFNTLFNSLDIGVRHVLPVYPLAFIVAAPIFAAPFLGLSERRRGVSLITAGLAAASLVWFASAPLSVAPRYLQYFNEMAGGPSRGHRMLIDSNLDWGQDLLRLRQYMREHGISSVQLAYFGRVDPRIYGIAYEPIERGRSHGWTAVSASFLMGRPYYWYYQGEIQWTPTGAYTWLQGYTPVARAGSMFIFNLP